MAIEARHHFGGALAIALELERAGMLAPADAAVPARLREALAALPAAP